MKTASGRVPEELYDWLEETAEGGDNTKAAILREALSDARAVREGEKILLEPPKRDIGRLDEYADRVGLDRAEAADELFGWALETDAEISDGQKLLLEPPDGVLEAVEDKAESKNMDHDEAAVRLLEDAIEEPSLLEKLRSTGYRVTAFGGFVIVATVAVENTFSPEPGTGKLANLIVLAGIVLFVSGVFLTTFTEAPRVSSGVYQSSMAAKRWFSR